MKFGYFFQQSIIIIFLAALLACSACQEGNGSPEIKQTATKLNSESLEVPDEQDWVVISQEQAEEMGLGAWLVESDGFWTPAEDDITILEEKIADYLSQNATLFNYQEPVWERLGEYQRQFIGLQRDGNNLIYGNYFCDNLGKNWRQEFISVEDGGNCYFQVEYDVQRGTFKMLMVNGES